MSAEATSSGGESDAEIERRLHASREATDLSLRERAALASLKSVLAGTSEPVRAQRYVVLEEVGHGGMGTVYSAFDPKLDRRVAIKVLSAAETDDVGGMHPNQRLLREARALAKLHHPNVVAIHDVGELDAGKERRVFVVMELVEGTRLDEWLRDAHPWREILKTMVGAGRGLAAAHEAGLTHRDFKPSNVILDKQGRARVLDFGLAVPARDPAHQPGPPDGLGPDEVLDENTRQGLIVGTPSYMAPEVLGGAEPDARSDQFSYCVALFRALFGVRPFGGRTVMELREETQAGRVRKSQTRRAVPAWLERAVLTGLRPRPGDRWPRMSDLLDHLERVPAARRRRTLVAGAAAGTAALSVAVFSIGEAAGPAASACRSPGEVREEIWSAADERRVTEALATSGKAFAQDVAGRVAGRLGAYADKWARRFVEACEAHARGELPSSQHDLRVHCLRSRQRELEALAGVYAEPTEHVVESAVQALGRLASADTCADDDALAAGLGPVPAELEDEALAVRGQLAQVRSLWSTGQYTPAFALAARARDAASRLGYRPLLAEALLEEGRLAAVREQLDRALESLNTAWRLSLREGHDLVAVQAATELVKLVGYTLRDLEGAQERAADAAAMLERMRDRGMSDVDVLESELLAAHADALLREHDFVRCARLYRGSYDLAVQARGADSLDAAEALARLGRFEMSRSQFDAGLRYSTSALERLRVLLGDYHPAVATTLNTIGLSHKNEARYEDARAAFDRALEVANASRGSGSREALTVRVNRASTLHQMGRLQEALHAYEQWEAHVPEGTAVGARPLANKAVVLAELGRHEEVDALVRRIEGLVDHELDEERARTLLKLGHALVRGERFDRAAARYEDARRFAGQRPGLLARATVGLAGMRQRAGDSDGAIRLATEALALIEGHSEDLAAVRRSARQILAGADPLKAGGP